jgi:5-(carboxyamino)imidazole ribonucleotide synthase
MMSPTSTVRSNVNRVGIIGGGQLAWMMAKAAEKLGVDLIVQTPQVFDPAVAIAAHTIFAEIDDLMATRQLAAQCDVITFENEFINLNGLAQLAAQGIIFRPPLAALEMVVDKYWQRQYYQKLGLATPQFCLPDEEIASQLSYPLVVKTRRFGYDGQGTFIVRSAQEYETLMQQFRDRGINPQEALLVEEFVPFAQELAVIAARSQTGELAIYPIVETQQKNQVCRWVLAPAAISKAAIAEAETIAHTLLTSLDAVGVFGIELFLTADDRVWINEIAPRVHNSGHFTLDACVTSQFEQHLRAVSGLSLGNPTMHSVGAVMINLLGYEESAHEYSTQRQQLAAYPGAHVHWYGKASRPGRKLGHVTVLLEQSERATALEIVDQIEALWYPSPLRSSPS